MCRVLPWLIARTLWDLVSHAHSMLVIKEQAVVFFSYSFIITIKTSFFVTTISKVAVPHRTFCFMLLILMQVIGTIKTTLLQPKDCLVEILFVSVLTQTLVKLYIQKELASHLPTLSL